MADINGKAIAAISVGALFIWSGIKGWSVLGTVRDIVSGQTPADIIAHPLDPTVFGGGQVGSVAGTALPGSGGSLVGGLAGLANGIAATAMQYQGHAYKYGGAPGIDGSKPWDCSSFVNFVCGIRLNLPIPGYSPGKYKGDVHGPPTGLWAAWNGFWKVSRSEVVAGDIIVWSGHMGIAISNSQMISALNPSAGTKVGAIDGAARGPIISIGRYT